MLQTLEREASIAGNGSAKPHLKIRNVTKRFGNFTALKSVSLDVLQGELVCFLGPSGCGKTTLLRAIAGLDIQSEGTIEIAGRDVSNLPPSERDFGIVFQSYALFPISRSPTMSATVWSIAAGTGRSAASASPSCWRSSASAIRAPSIRCSCRAASSSAWRLPGRSPLHRPCCCSTSRCRRSTPACGFACARRSSRCSAGSASPLSWSPMTRRRRWRWPIASW